MKNNVTNAINCYRAVITAAWADITKIASFAKTDSYLDDWLQSNWEMIVECSLPPEAQVFLRVYGEGADCNGSSSRVWSPTADATHCVICKVLAKKIPIDLLTNKPVPSHVPLIFDKFVAYKEGWYYGETPFDSVFIDCGVGYVIPVQGLDFVLQKLE